MKKPIRSNSYYGKQHPINSEPNNGYNRNKTHFIYNYPQKIIIT